MKIIAVIPARYASTRFHAKLMQDLGGKTVITRTYEAALNSGLFDDVFVATDSDLIFQEIKANHGKVVMSVKEHESGSDRIAEAVADIACDIVVNVQGDEPFINKETIAALILEFRKDKTQSIDVVSAMRPISDIDDINNPNNVKVVTDDLGYALYFSRSVIPFPRDGDVQVDYHQHIGIYAYRKEALMDFHRLPMKSLEAVEKLEQLRYLEYGKRIKMIITSEVSIGIDTPEDLEKARKMI